MTKTLARDGTSDTFTSSDSQTSINFYYGVEESLASGEPMEFWLTDSAMVPAGGTLTAAPDETRGITGRSTD